VGGEEERGMARLRCRGRIRPLGEEGRTAVNKLFLLTGEIKVAVDLNNDI
jgi:hypothetical protein